MLQLRCKQSLQVSKWHSTSLQHDSCIHISTYSVSEISYKVCARELSSTIVKCRWRGCQWIERYCENMVSYSYNVYIYNMISFSIHGWGRWGAEGGLYRPLAQRQSRCILNKAQKQPQSVLGQDICWQQFDIPCGLISAAVAPYTL